MNASRRDNPKPKVRTFLMEHRGRPYFSELLDEARVTLKLNKYGKIRRKETKSIKLMPSS